MAKKTVWCAAEMWDEVKRQLKPKRGARACKPFSHTIPFAAVPRIVTAPMDWSYNAGHRR
jgi:hypothetical protein